LRLWILILLVLTSSVVLGFFIGYIENPEKSSPLQTDENNELSENVGVQDKITAKKWIKITMKKKVYCGTASQGFMKKQTCMT